MALPALAQEKPKADPVLQELVDAMSPEAIKQRQMRAIQALIDAYEAQQRMLAADRKYWAEYVSGLYRQ